MVAHLTGLLWVSLSDLSEEQVSQLKKAYSYPHPHDPLQIFETFVEHQGRLGLPYGNQVKLNNLLGEFELIDKRIAQPVQKPFIFTKGLRPYQADVEQQILQYLTTNSAFNLAGTPGSGKTYMLASLLSKLQIKTLVIAHLSMLTEQIYKEFSENTTADIQVLSAKSKQLSDINIATSQFISQNPDLWYQIKHEIGVIVVDEAESLGSQTTLRIIQRAHAKYKILISATFSRPNDGRTWALKDFAGVERFVLQNPETMKPMIFFVHCPEQFPQFFSQAQYARNKSKFYMQTSIIDKICLITQASLKKDRQVLIATDIIEQQVLLAGLLGGAVLNGQTSAKDRSRILEEFDSGKTKVIIGAAVLNAGLSIPKISVIIRVAFPTVDTKNVQLVGRALRQFPEKQGAWVFDLVFPISSTSEDGSAKPSEHKRAAGYKKEGWNVKHVQWSSLETKLRKDLDG